MKTMGGLHKKILALYDTTINMFIIYWYVPAIEIILFNLPHVIILSPTGFGNNSKTG